MNVVPFSGGRGPSDTTRLPIVDTATWIGRNPPERRFIVDGWLARGTAALLVGEDGIGKSLLAQQLATCVAAGRPFLGMPVERAAAIYITCEDDADELWRRQRGINAALSLPADCAPAMLSSLVGQMDVDLSALTPAGAIGPSPLARAIVDVAKEYRAGLIILDNLAHLFSGNENVRRDVAVFCSLLERMAIDADATVLLLGHPSKGGAEYSGSTGWSAHVRQRWFLERPEAGSMGVDRDARVLRKSKANYSASGTEVAFRWHEWAFVTEDQIPHGRERQCTRSRRERGFLTVLRRLHREASRGVAQPRCQLCAQGFRGHDRGQGLQRSGLQAGVRAVALPGRDRARSGSLAA